uniref:uncharacterized protein n=1 Tax=Lonchura striata TaxID=40157 RepID=UPI00129328AE|nr:uncharacterized protein LOC116184726 [Lonchura striata domestica]
MAAHAGSPPGPGMSRQRRQSWPRLDPDTAEYFRRALETLEEGLSEEELGWIFGNFWQFLGISASSPPVPPPKGAEPKTKGAELKAKGAWSLPEGAELPASFRLLLEELAQGLEQQIPALLPPPLSLLAASPDSFFLIGRPLCLLLSHWPSPLLTSLQDPAHSRLLEAAMTALDPPGLRELFRGHLRGHLRGVASHPVANHGLQRLLDHAPEDVVEEVLSELGPALEEPLARGHPGVVLALLGAALRHPRLQGEVLRWLFQALRCWAPPHHPHCVAALAKLRPLEGGASTEGAELQLDFVLKEIGLFSQKKKYYIF